MLNPQTNQRELAYIVAIDEIKPIPNYDRVEHARVGGWWVIVKKDQFQVGDLAIYIEVDSRVPEQEPFMFLDKKNFKVKTQKMCKVLSQGLLMHPADFGWNLGKVDGVDNGSIIIAGSKTFKLGDFVTEFLKITYAEAEDNKRKANSADKYKLMAQRNGKLFAKQPFRWLMRRDWGKKLLFVFFGRKKDKKNGWPAWVVKTDEERIECIPHTLLDKTPWIASEKLDGTSTTFTMKRGRFGKNLFLICSRNVVFDKPDKKCYYETNVYTEMAQKYDVENVLSSILLSNPELEWVTLQGETYGAGIQKRDYGLTEHFFAGFNYITSKDGRWNSVKARDFMQNFNIPWVPIIDENYILPDTIEELRAFSHSEGSRIDGLIKEGIVFRSQDGSRSFKCVDPEFLLKYHS